MTKQKQQESFKWKYKPCQAMMFQAETTEI